MQHLAKQKKQANTIHPKFKSSVYQELYLNSEKDFIYYTEKNDSRAYAQDAPSIQAHTHTYITALIIYYYNYYDNYNRE